MNRMLSNITHGLFGKVHCILGQNQISSNLKHQNYGAHVLWPEEIELEISNKMKMRNAQILRN